MLGLPRYRRASGMFAGAHVDGFFRMIVGSLMGRMRRSSNSLLVALTQDLHSSIMGHWMMMLKPVSSLVAQSQIGVMIFLGYFLIYLIRYNLSVHIVAMAHISIREDYWRNLEYHNHSAISFQRTKMRSGVDAIGWDDTKMGTLFSAYHIGFCVCFPIFHSFGDRVGPTWVVGISGLISGVLCCMIPASAFLNFWAVYLLRMVKGFCAGAMQPSMVQVLRHWVPPIERNHFMWAYCGITMGTCCTFLICAAVHFYARWPVGFFISGGLQIFWSIFWVVIVTDSPKLHSFISKEELEYLNHTVGNIFTIKITNSQVPWKIILRSVPFWALCILNFGYSWIIIALCIHGPLFYSRIADYNIYDASALTALPFFLRLVLGTIIIQTFHWYKHNSRLKRIRYIRKYFIVVSHVIPGLILSISWLFPIIPGPILLSTAVAMTAAGMDLTLDLSYEISPNFVNSITTVNKIIGNTSGIIVSLSVGHVTTVNENSPAVWKHIWCFHGAVLFLSGLVFLIWGSTEVQPWNFRRVRSPRKHIIFPKASVMSDITEMEESSGTLRSSQIITLSTMH